MVSMTALVTHEQRLAAIKLASVLYNMLIEAVPLLVSNKFITKANHVIAREHLFYYYNEVEQTWLRIEVQPATERDALMHLNAKQVHVTNTTPPTD